MPEGNPEATENVSDEREVTQVKAAKKEEEQKSDNVSVNGGVQLQQQASEDDRNTRSVFVKNVHYTADKKEIEEHFADCGEIKMITIAMNKMTH
jgi:RNA recognition motif-containing protein